MFIINIFNISTIFIFLLEEFSVFFFYISILLVIVLKMIRLPLDIKIAMYFYMVTSLTDIYDLSVMNIYKQTKLYKILPVLWPLSKFWWCQSSSENYHWRRPTSSWFNIWSDLTFHLLIIVECTTTNANQSTSHSISVFRGIISHSCPGIFVFKF